jgi:hypothetical protein
MEIESTHFIFDGESIQISPDLEPIIGFLMEIEKEIETILGFESRLSSIRRSFQELIGLIRELAKKLESNSIDFKYEISESPEKIAEYLKIERPARSEMVVLFAHLEALLCLNIAYQNKTSDHIKIISLAMDKKTVRKFIRDYCLSENNEWVKKNQQRVKHISVDDFRILRNSLTHFFSAGERISISNIQHDEKARKIEQFTKHEINFISPRDLDEIVRGAAKLMITEWSNECRRCIEVGSSEFKEKILAVNNVVIARGSVTVKSDEVNV